MLLTEFAFVIHQAFQIDGYSKLVNNKACAESVWRKLGPGMTYVTNAMSEQIKAGTKVFFAESGMDVVQ